MSRKRKQSKRAAAPAPAEAEAVPEEILAEGSGQVERVDAAELAEAANAVGRRRKKRRAPEASADGEAGAPDGAAGEAAGEPSDELEDGDGSDAEASSGSEASASSEASADPEASAEPEASAGSEASAEPEASAGSEASAEPEDAGDSEAVVAADAGAGDEARADAAGSEEAGRDAVAEDAEGPAAAAGAGAAEPGEAGAELAGSEAAGAEEEGGELGAVLPTSAASMDAAQLKHLVEALIFASDKPLTIARLRQLTRVSDTKRLEQALATIAEDFRERGIVLQQVSGGYQFRTRTQFSAWVQQLIAGRPVRLSRAQLETLAIIAYRQPITRPEIDEIRGVDSSATLKLLIDRALIRILGKKEEVGRPMLYGTTKEFLDFFSLGDLRELPTLREYSELTDESRQVMSARLGIQLDDTARAAGGDGGEGSGGGGEGGFDPGNVPAGEGADLQAATASAEEAEPHVGALEDAAAEAHMASTSADGSELQMEPAPTDDAAAGLASAPAEEDAASAASHVDGLEADAEPHVGSPEADAVDALEATDREVERAVMDDPEWPEGSGRVGEAMFDAEPAAGEVADDDAAGAVDPAIIAERAAQPSLEPPPE